MEQINKALELLDAEYTKEFGEDAKLEDGESMVGVFNDCMITVSIVDRELKIDVNMNRPYIIDHTLGI